MPQHSYKQLEEAYQRGVNKEHKPNPARTHPMTSQQGKWMPGDANNPNRASAVFARLPVGQRPRFRRHESESKHGKHKVGQRPQQPSRQPCATPYKAEGRQHGPARTAGSTR